MSERRKHYEKVQDFERHSGSSVAVSGGKSPYTYQWYVDTPTLSTDLALQNNTVVSGAKSAVVNVKSTKLSENGSKFYCVITDAEGNKITSGKALLTVTAPLSITTQPKNVSASVGGTATFSVAVSGGKAPYAYQWFKSPTSGLKDTKISGATSSTYKISSVTKGNGSYTYYCVITDANGDIVSSNEASLTVTAASLEVDYGWSGNTCVASVTGGSGTYTYYWYREYDMFDSIGTFLGTDDEDLGTGKTCLIKDTSDYYEDWENQMTYENITYYLEVRDSAGNYKTVVVYK